MTDWANFSSRERTELDPVLQLQPSDRTSLRITRIFKASRDRVWQAITDPEEVARWYAPWPMAATIHKFDVQLGGSFELDMTGPDGVPHGVFGKFIEIVPGRRIVQTWRWKDFPIDSGESRLSIELREVSEGTELILTQEKLADPTSVTEHTKGWTSSLEQLGKIL